MVLLVASCGDNPSAPSPDNGLDQANPVTGGDPFALRASNSGEAIALGWVQVNQSGLTGYSLKRESAGSVGYVEIGVVSAGSNSFLDNQVQRGRVYSYKIAAKFSNGRETDVSWQAPVRVNSLGEFHLGNGDGYCNAGDTELSVSAVGCDSVWVWNGGNWDEGRWLVKSQDATVFSWELEPGEGLRTVSGRLHYKSGARQVVSATVLVDLTPPDPSGLIPTPFHQETDALVPLVMSWTGATDGESGIRSYRILLDTIDPPSMEVYAGPDSFFQCDHLAATIPHFWQVLVSDRAGNESAGEIWTFTPQADNFLFFEAGSFLMGSPPGEPGHSDLEAQHLVTLSRNILVAPTEVTEELWDSVMGTGESQSQLPKVMVSWNEAIQFCNQLSTQRGLRPVYTYYGSGRASWNTYGDGYRLPSEAEWEFACRAGTETAFSSGGITDLFCADNLLDTIGFYCGNANGQRGTVASFLPNPRGLYDVHGNAWEWCFDVFVEDLEAARAGRPKLVVTAEAYRTIRGGSWASNAQHCRSASRVSYHPAYRNPYIGLRLVRNAPPAKESPTQSAASRDSGGNRHGG